MSPQPRSQQHPGSQEELWVGWSFFPESPWVAAAGWARRSPAGPLFSTCECARAVSLSVSRRAKSQNVSMWTGQEEKGVSMGRSCLERELITMVICSYTCGSAGEERDQLVDWKCWGSFAVLILTVFLKIAHGFLCSSRRS